MEGLRYILALPWQSFAISNDGKLTRVAFRTVVSATCGCMSDCLRNFQRPMQIAICRRWSEAEEDSSPFALCKEPMNRHLAGCALLAGFLVSYRAQAVRSLVYAPTLSEYADAPDCAHYHGDFIVGLYSIPPGGECREWLNDTDVKRFDQSFDQLDDDHELLYVERSHWLQDGIGHDGDPGMDWYRQVESHMNSIYDQAISTYSFDRLKGVVAQYFLGTPRKALSASEALMSSTAADRPRILIINWNALVYLVPKAILPILDQIFPANANLVSVPSYPLPRRALASSAAPSAKSVPEWLNTALKKVHYSPLVDAIIQDIDPKQIQKDVRHLTAEDETAAWQTRHSFTTGGKLAAEWIKGDYYSGLISLLSDMSAGE